MPSSLNTTSLGSIHADGSKRILHPADVTGRFTRWRRIVAALLLVIYVALPWIPVNGFPAVFLDALHRRFHFFGLTLATQDLWVFFFLVTGLGFSLFCITSVLGRVWCGWTCPYTVFLEHVFRRVERLIDGDASARRQLDRAPMTAAKFARRALKHSAYLLISAVIAHIFLSYFVSLSVLYDMMKGPPKEHLFAFGVVTFLTGALYFAFSWFREQFCVILCPYGRMQSALSDEHTVIIGYDKKRGEPRGRATDPNAGDCIDCKRCVQVCPTGIDIRNGLQLECIGCAACVDACNDIMTKLKRPAGLVRYDSHVALNGGRTRFIRPRTIFYACLLAAGAAAFVFATSRIDPVFASVQRTPGSAYVQADGLIRNQFLVRLINKQSETRSYRLTLEGAHSSDLKISGTDTTITLGAQAEEQRPLVLTLPTSSYHASIKLTIRATDNESGASAVTRTFEFIGPDTSIKNNDYLDPKQYLQK